MDEWKWMKGHLYHPYLTMGTDDKRGILKTQLQWLYLWLPVFFLVAFFWFGWCVKTEARTRCPWCYCTSVVRWPCTKANTSQHTMLNEMDILAKLRSERETNRQNHLFSLEPDGEMTNHPTSYNSQAWCFMIIDNIPLHFLLPGNS